MKPRVGIFGTSGMAKESHDIAHELDFDVVYIARDMEDTNAVSSGDDVILESDLEQLVNFSFVIGIGDGNIRREIASRFNGKIKFTNLIHPDTSFGRSQRSYIENRKGVIICAGVRFTSDIKVGDFTIFNLNATISHDSILEDFVTVSPQACILGNVHIGTCAWIGAGAIINQGDALKRKIGENTVIGSGAVVVNDCAPDSVYVGIPARKIK